MAEIDHFLKNAESKEVDLIWVGESHGIENNFEAYKYLIGKLEKIGYKTIALEYPENLEDFTAEKFLKYSSYEDGRFSEESLKFFKWLFTTQIRILCFDVRHKVKSQQEGEDVMAENLLSKLKKGEKTLVISGSFHGRRAPERETIPQAGIVEKAGYKILSICLKYAGGKFYNFGLKEEDNRFIDFDDQNLPFGSITINSNPMVDYIYWFHVGKGIPVTLIQ